jgi:hypothetical protein
MSMSTGIVRRHRRVVVAAFVILVGAGAVPAHASNFSGANGGVGCHVNVADNKVHSIWYHQVTAATRQAVSWSRSHNYDPTVVDTVTEDARDRLTDVIAMDADYEGTTCGRTWMPRPTGAGLIGMVICQSLSGRRCNQFHMMFDNDFMGPQPSANENALACHELGHTVGLMHVTSGCLVTGGGTSSSLREHDRRHLSYYQS